MFYKFFKRTFDFMCAVVGITITSPIWIVAVLGILVSDFGPLFYVATRIGKDNKPFKMYKFRSMRVAKAANEASLRPDEDRIFPFGHFIRKEKIDELPQLLNILNGTMSVIGPRPVAQRSGPRLRHNSRMNAWQKRMISASLFPRGAKSDPPLPPPIGNVVKAFLKVCSNPKNFRMDRLTDS